MELTINNKTQILPLQVNLSVVCHNDSPTIVLSRSTQDIEQIKKIVTAAFYNQPIYLQPYFKDRLRALATLQEKGIIYRQRVTENKKEVDKFYFCF